MEIIRKNVRGSPFVGIFLVVTEKIGLFPRNAFEQKELKEISGLLGVESIEATIASSPLLGVLAAGNSNGIIVSNIAEEKEIEELTEMGLRIMKVREIAAVGNLLKANDKGGLCAKIFSNETQKKIEKTLKVPIKSARIAKTDLVGGCLVATNNGFLANPNISEEEFSIAKAALKADGTTTTANYGDVFVGNSIVANSKAAITGEQTSGVEMIRIDEGIGRQ